MNRQRAEFDELSYRPTERPSSSRAGAAGTRSRDTRSRPTAKCSPAAITSWPATGTSQTPPTTPSTGSRRSDGEHWFHTGDGGTIDDEHYVTITDRKKDVIISGGENVSSIEVEDAVFSHPEVAEVAVIGVPDEKWGELVMALVVARRGRALTEADVIAYTKTKLAGYKCPKQVEFRDTLARTATGKLQKFKLREPYWTGQTRTDQLTRRVAVPR